MVGGIGVFRGGWWVFFLGLLGVVCFFGFEWEESCGIVFFVVVGIGVFFVGFVLGKLYVIEFL